MFPVDGGFGPWSNYSSCSVTCGGGIKTRERKCDTPKPAHGGTDCLGAKTETDVCATNPCPGIIRVLSLKITTKSFWLQIFQSKIDN